MSSPISLPLGESEATLVGAASEVAENCLFTFVDPSEESSFEAQASALPSETWVTARVQFSGPSAGEFGLTAPEGLVRRLCAAFSGEESPETLAMGALADFAGEFANMVCGAWLTRLCPTVAFDLAAPTVSRGSHHASDCGVPSRAHAFFVAVDDTPVRFWVDQRPPYHQEVARAS